MDKGIKQVVILLAHPDIKSSQANKALMDAVKEMEEVAIYNLYGVSEVKTATNGGKNRCYNTLIFS